MTYIIYYDDKVLDIYPGCWAAYEVADMNPNVWSYWEQHINKVPVIAYCIDADLYHVCNDNMDFKPEWYDKLKLKVV